MEALIFTQKIFANQVVLITGGGTGLGKTTAIQFGKLGASLVIAGRREEELKESAEEIAATGAAVETFFVDIRDSASVQQMVDRAADRFSRIDILVNNAADNFPVHA